MSRTDTGSPYEKLNQLGKNWIRKDEANHAVWGAQLIEAESLIFQMAYIRVYKRDAVNDLSDVNLQTQDKNLDHYFEDEKMDQFYDAADRIIAELKKNNYCPYNAAGKYQELGSYVSTRLGFRIKDAERNEEKEQSKIAHSLDEVVNEETETSIGDITDAGVETPEEILQKKEEQRKQIDPTTHLLMVIGFMCASVIMLQESILRENGGAHQKARLRKRRICYTEKISGLSRKCDLKKLSNEKNICNAVDHEYFHFFTDCDGDCDSIEKLSTSPLKPWDMIEMDGIRIFNDGVSREPLDWDKWRFYLPIAVPAKFTGMSLSTVSNMRSDFEAILADAELREEFA